MPLGALLWGWAPVFGASFPERASFEAALGAGTQICFLEGTIQRADRVFVGGDHAPLECFTIQALIEGGLYALNAFVVEDMEAGEGRRGDLAEGFEPREKLLLFVFKLGHLLIHETREVGRICHGVVLFAFGSCCRDETAFAESLESVVRGWSFDVGETSELVGARAWATEAGQIQRRLGRGETEIVEPLEGIGGFGGDAHTHILIKYRIFLYLIIAKKRHIYNYSG